MLEHLMNNGKEYHITSGEISERNKVLRSVNKDVLDNNKDGKTTVYYYDRVI